MRALTQYRHSGARVASSATPIMSEEWDESAKDFSPPNLFS